MLKCTLRSPKTINGGIGEKTFSFEKKLFCPGNYFFHRILCHLGTRWKQERNGCHGCIQNEFSKWVGTHEIFQLNDMSKIWQKNGF